MPSLTFSPIIVAIFALFLFTEAVKSPSASASTSFSSSLLNLASKNDQEDLEDRQIHHHRLKIQEDPHHKSLSGGSSINNNNREECRVKNLRQQQRMAVAKLDAHRCLVRDTVVALAPPDDVIAEFVTPSHVVVPRCTGKKLCFYWK